MNFNNQGFPIFTSFPLDESIHDTRDRQIAQLKRSLEAHEKHYQTFSAAPFQLGFVAAVQGTRVLLKFLGGGAFMVEAPEWARRPGLMVQIGANESKGPGIAAKSDVKLFGHIGVVKSVGAGVAYVEIKGQPEQSFLVAEGLELVAGDRVAVADMCLVFEKVGDGDASSMFQTDTEDVDWSDVIGQDKARDALHEAIVLPALHPEVYAAYGQSPARGVVLHGPPGVGKTLLGKAVATHLRRERRGGDFFCVKGPELLDKFVGESERNIRELFKAARAASKRSGGVSVILLDEADAILGARENNHFNGMEKTVVPQFLTELDGASKRGDVFVMIATNRPDLLDAAVVRDGRFDRRVRLERPSSREDVSALVAHYLSKTCLHPDFDRELAVDWVMRQPVRAGGKLVRLCEVMSGALARGLVERASNVAVKRELAAGGKGERGVTLDDFRRACELAALEVPTRDVNEAVG